MTYLWAGMMMTGIIWGIASGNAGAVAGAALEGAEKGVSLCITMLGALAVWSGLMKVAEHSGLVRVLTKKMMPALALLFPDIPKEHPSFYYMALNMIANILGLGWAATPAGLKAMEQLRALSDEQAGRAGRLPAGHPTACGERAATKEMCTFLVINISSLQLIPVTMIAFRTEYGSPVPTLITGPAILATLVSTLAGIAFSLVACRAERRRS